MNDLFFCYISDGTIVAEGTNRNRNYRFKENKQIKIPKLTTIVSFGINYFISNVSSTIRS